jgi:PAS domain S-box-containing protein
MVKGDRLNSSIPPGKRTRQLLWGATLGLTIAIVLSQVSMFAYFSANHWVNHTLEVEQEIDRWVMSLLQAQSNVLGYFISGQHEYVARFESSLQLERAHAASLRELIADNPIQINNFDAADRGARATMDLFSGLVKTASLGRRKEVVLGSNSLQSQSSINAFNEGWHRVRAEEERLLVERRAASRFRAQVSLLGTVSLSIVSFGLLAYAWGLLRLREKVLTEIAEDARRRLRSLSDIAAALSQARTKAEVVDVVVNQGMRIASADTCVLYLMNESESTLELLGERGIAPEIVDNIRHISATSGNPDTFATTVSGVSLWAESEADYLSLFPALAGMKVEGPRAKAFWSVPLFVEGRPLGLFAMGFYEPRVFSIDDRSVVETLSKQCAQALLRATLVEREDEARRWLDTTLRSIGDAVIATDPKGRITFMNAIAETLTGYSEAEARGQVLDNVFRIFSEQTRAVVESPVTKVLREGTVVGLANHTMLRSRRGVEIPIDDSGAPIRNEMGQIAGVVLVFRDVTQDKRLRVRREFLSQATEALVSSLEYQSTLATVSRLAVPRIADWCAVDLVDSADARPYQAVVSHVDPSKLEFVRKLGELYPPDPNASTGAPQVIRTGKAELYQDIPEALLEQGARDAEHLRLLRELKLESAIVVPLKGRRRTLGAITFIYADSGRRYAEDDLEFAEDFAHRAAMAIENALALKEAEAARNLEQELRSEAEAASRAKDEFLAVVSHELRTPLNSILGWTVILRGRKPSKEIDHGLVVIERNARAQAKLVEDVLDVSRVISGKLSLTLGHTNVSDAIEAAVETVAPAAEDKHIAISCEVGESTLAITADASRVQQIVWNLLSNAVKFTPKGGRISISASRRGSEICISVVDTGEGILPSALPFVFEPFQQADSSTTRQHGGLGLGLAIVKHLVSAHGGTVSVSSEGKGKGSTFVVRLPARSAVPAIRTNRSPSLEDFTTHVSKHGPRLDGLAVLLVDDEQDALEVIGEVLRNHGAEVYLASSAERALSQLEQLRPDVILSDIGMPVMDGFTLIRKIRALPAELGGRTPAAALTAYARTEDAQRAFAAGFQMHIAKPVEPTQLATVVANLGGRSLEV